MEEKIEKSPLEKLVEIQQAHQSAMKLSPKDRLEAPEPVVRIITPLVEDTSNELQEASHKVSDTMMISNSSLVFNLNLNIDSEVVDKAFEKSAKVAKSIAAAGAAMLGTALIFGSSAGKKLDKVKIPVNPKPKIRPIKKI